MPFSNENAPRVFSLPPPKGENAPPPVFTPFVDKRQPLGSASGSRPVLGERTPLHPVFSPPTDDTGPLLKPIQKQVEESGPEPEPEPEPEFEVEHEPDLQSETPTTESDADAHSQYEAAQFDMERVSDALTSESSEDDFGFVDYEQPVEQPVVGEGDDPGMSDDDETGERRVPLGGRFGQFAVMTPIIERTYEYTNSTRGMGTPGYTIHSDADALEAAGRLAAELEEEEEEEVANIEERTGTLSLADALGVASSFRPPNPCNPFDPEIVTTLLRLIPPEPGFHDLRGTDSHQLDALQKFAKKKSRHSTSSRSAQDADTLEVRLHDRRFAVVDKLGEGGFGAVFEAIDLALARKKRADGDSDLDDDDDDDDDDEEDEAHRVALKVVAPRNLWEFHILRRIHATLPADARRSLIAPHALYAFRDESFLVLALRKQGTLLDVVNRAAGAGITQHHGAGLDELLVAFFAAELLRALDALHRAGFVHGDVKIDNCLLRLDDVPGAPAAWAPAYDPRGGGGWAHKGVALIDFGRALDTRLFPAGQRFLADWPVDARDCPEMRAGRPWTFEPDYFGLAGVVYCMLYGKYIEASSVVPVDGPEGAEGGRVRYRLATPFKRYWQGELWARLFDVLLNPTLVRADGSLPVADELAAVRADIEAWLQANCNRASNSLKGLLKKVSLAMLGGKG